MSKRQVRHIPCDEYVDGRGFVEKRTVCYIPGDGYVEGKGYRVAFVIEGETGYHPTGTWPYHGAAGETMPWFWGPTYEDAERCANEYNERLGISKDDAMKIVGASMFPPKKKNPWMPQ